MKPDKKYCIGCDQNYYNHPNPQGVKECWHFKDTAKLVTKYCIGWWTPQNKASNFWKVKTNSCHTENGRFAYYDKIPAHLRNHRQHLGKQEIIGGNN